MRYYEKKQREPAYDLRSMLSRTAARVPEKDYLVYKRCGELESVTFSGFEERVRALSEAFLELGLEGAPVAVIGETSPEWIITYLATVISGGVIVPLDKELSAEAVCGFIRKVGCRFVVYSHKFGTYFENKEEFPTVDYFISVSPEKKECSEPCRPEKGEADFLDVLNFGRKLAHGNKKPY